jgi:hypothetical protein
MAHEAGDRRQLRPRTPKCFLVANENPDSTVGTWARPYSIREAVRSSTAGLWHWVGYDVELEAQ